jgi:hypothetical protein
MSCSDIDGNSVEHTHHDWPYKCSIKIEHSQRFCGYCAGKAATKRYPSSNRLRDHVKRHLMHGRLQGMVTMTPGEMGRPRMQLTARIAARARSATPFRDRGAALAAMSPLTDTNGQTPMEETVPPLWNAVNMQEQISTSPPHSAADLAAQLHGLRPEIDIVAAKHALSKELQQVKVAIDVISALPALATTTKYAVLKLLNQWIVSTKLKLEELQQNTWSSHRCQFDQVALPTGSPAIITDAGEQQADLASEGELFVTDDEEGDIEHD